MFVFQYRQRTSTSKNLDAVYGGPVSQFDAHQEFLNPIQQAHTLSFPTEWKRRVADILVSESNLGGAVSTILYFRDRTRLSVIPRCLTHTVTGQKFGIGGMQSVAGGAAVVG